MKLSLNKCLLVGFVLVLFSVSSSGQEVWSLEKCVQHAWENSLTVEQARINLDVDKINANEARHSRYPNLNFNTNWGLNFGRAINPSTNNFESENSSFISNGLQGGITVFAGNRINNSIRQSDLNVEASTFDIRQAEYDLALNVALAYINVLFAEENLANAESQLELTQEQLDQVDKLIDAGVRPANERYDILAQIALEEQNIVQTRNTREINMLNLKNLLLLDPGFEMNIEKPAIDLVNQERLELQDFDAVYQAALGSQPGMQAADLRLRSAELDVDLARGSMFPTLSVGGSVGTNYSNLFELPTGFINQRVKPFSEVFIEGYPMEFEVADQIPTEFERVGFFDQYDQNLGYGVSATLSVPLYNNLQARSAKDRAELNILRTKTQTEELKQTLKTNVQNAIAEARAARESLTATEKSLEASEIALSNAQKRYDLGAINTFDFISAKNRMDQAQVSHSIAKYDYLFKVKVIEYYMGRGMQLN